MYEDEAKHAERDRRRMPMTAMPAVTFRTVCLDCDDAQAMARFYGALLGWTPTRVEPGWVLMRDPGGAVGLSFQQDDRYERPTWPEEAGSQQKMMHLEIRVSPQVADGEDGYS